MVKYSAEVGKIAIRKAGYEDFVKAPQVGHRSAAQHRSPFLGAPNLDGPAIVHARMPFDQTSGYEAVHQAGAGALGHQHGAAQLGHPQGSPGLVQLDQNVVVLQGKTTVATEVGVQYSGRLAQIAKHPPPFPQRWIVGT